MEDGNNGSELKSQNVVSGPSSGQHLKNDDKNMDAYVKKLEQKEAVKRDKMVCNVLRLEMLNKHFLFVPACFLFADIQGCSN